MKQKQQLYMVEESVQSSDKPNLSDTRVIAAPRKWPWYWTEWWLSAIYFVNRNFIPPKQIYVYTPPVKMYTVLS